MRSAVSRASSPAPTAPSLPGTTGTPASAIAFRAATLSPIVSICFGDGPMKAMPWASTTSAKCAFSERKP